MDEKRQAEIREVQIIYNAARENWKAVAWWLSHRYPERWGRTTKHEVTGRYGEPIEVDDSREILLNIINQMIARRTQQ